MNVHLDACKFFFKFDCTKLKFKKKYYCGIEFRGRNWWLNLKLN